MIPRRALSFHVSLVLALLRKKLAEFDASGAETRLILTRDQLVEMVRMWAGVVVKVQQQEAVMMRMRGVRQKM